MYPIYKINLQTFTSRGLLTQTVHKREALLRVLMHTKVLLAREPRLHEHARLKLH